jgi:hypothetical protein
MSIEYSGQRRALLRELEPRVQRYRTSQRFWSFWYWISLYATPIAAGGATIAAAVGGYETATTILAAAATLLGTASATGRFGEKWRANRTSRSKIEVLLIEARTNLAANDDLLREELERVISDQDLAILGPQP